MYVLMYEEVYWWGYLEQKSFIELVNWVMRSITKVRDKKRGGTSSVFLQCKTNDRADAHLPCTITISGGLHLSSRSVAPPIRKPCWRRSWKPAAFQMPLHLPMNQSLFKGAHSSSVSNAKNGASSGTLALTRRWYRRGGMGLVTAS